MRVAREAWFFGGSACKLYGFRELSPAACDFQNHPYPGSKFRKLAAPLAGPGWNPCLGCHWTLSGLKRYTALERGAGKTAPWGEVLVPNPDDLSSIPITHVVDRDNWLPRAVLGPLCERRTMARVPPLPLHTHTKEERKKGRKSGLEISLHGESWFPGAQPPWLTLGRGLGRSKL